MNRLLIAGLAAVLTFGVTAASAGTTVTAGWSWVQPPVAHVGVVGDSLTYEAEHGPGPDPYYQRHRLIDELGAQGFASRVAARSGTDTRSLSMWGQWASPPEVLVMALGTNDAIRAYQGVDSLKASLARTDTYLARYPAACVVGVGVVTTAYRGLNVHGSAWNTAIAARVDVFVDWNALVQPGDLTGDQTHHTTQGQAHYRQAIVEGVKLCP